MRYKEAPFNRPIYLAPEIIKEKGHDERVDIWCIGVLLFELITGSVPFQGNDIETLKSNILHLRITWPKEMNPDAKDLISKILKLDPNQRLPLEDMLQHPFFLKYFPDAPSCLILPDPNIIYKTFAVSKDDPETWDPVQKNVFYENITIGPIDNISGSNNKKEAKPKDKYTLLQEKYENLKNDYYAYKSGNQSINEIDIRKTRIEIGSTLNNYIYDEDALLIIDSIGDYMRSADYFNAFCKALEKVEYYYNLGKSGGGSSRGSSSSSSSSSSEKSMSVWVVIIIVLIIVAAIGITCFRCISRGCDIDLSSSGSYTTYSTYSEPRHHHHHGFGGFHSHGGGYHKSGGFSSGGHSSGGHRSGGHSSGGHSSGGGGGRSGGGGGRSGGRTGGATGGW